MNRGGSAVIDDAGQTETGARPGGNRPGMMFRLLEINRQTKMTVVEIRSDLLPTMCNTLKNPPDDAGPERFLNACQCLGARMSIAGMLQDGKIHGSGISNDGRPFSEIAVRFVDVERPIEETGEPA